MGRSFTSTQIYNPRQLDQTTIIDLFCNGMKELGYMPCTSNDDDISYIMRFSEGCKWVCITSDAYGQGNQYAQTDTGKIAKMLKTICINTTIIDSDCAIMNLYDESEKKKDSIIMGRADEYFGNEISDPIESEWSPLLEGDHTWEQLLEVQKAHYVFIEDGISEIAPIIGLTSKSILFSADNVENDEFTATLCFRKNATKKEMKLTLNKAFDIVFGEALKPLGFQKIKSRYPYYIKLVNNEIIHVITYISTTSSVPGKKAFEVYGGVASIYRDTIDFSINPRNNTLWMCSNFAIFKHDHPIRELLLRQLNNWLFFLKIRQKNAVVSFPDF